MAYEFDWVDAFTDVPFGGNGCVVVHGAQALSIGQRTALVRETNLSECAYLVGSDKADFGARYYLAGREILMAGHPTIATIRALIHRGLIAVPGQVTLEVGAGVLPIEISGTDDAPIITMTQATPEFGATFDPGEIASIYGLSDAAVIAAPQMVSTGTAFCITALRSKTDVDMAVLDGAKLLQWREKTGVETEPFLMACEGASSAGDTFARLLMPPPNPAEDPFTGSATGCMAAYLWAQGLIDQPRFVAEQGHQMGRPGRAEVEVLGPRDDIEGVKVGGQGVVLMQGQLMI